MNYTEGGILLEGGWRYPWAWPVCVNELGSSGGNHAAWAESSSSLDLADPLTTVRVTADHARHAALRKVHLTGAAVSARALLLRRFVNRHELLLEHRALNRRHLRTRRLLSRLGFGGTLESSIRRSGFRIRALALEVHVRAVRPVILQILRRDRMRYRVGARKYPVWSESNRPVTGDAAQLFIGPARRRRRCAAREISAAQSPPSARRRTRPPCPTLRTPRTGDRRRRRSS